MKVQALALAATFVAAAVASPAPLKSPFPAAAAQPRELKPEFECGTPPGPVRRLEKISKYDQDDPTRSKIDPESEARLREQNEPVTQFVRELVKMTDEVVLDPANGGARADCAWRWLASWAHGHSLEGKAVAETIRKWELATIASSVLKLQDRARAPVRQQAAVHDWLRRLAEQVRADYTRGTRLPSRQNNHLYWAGWAVTAAAIAIDDRELFDWGMSVYDTALAQIQPDGHLPLEAARASRALGYHSFALLPLVMIAEAGEVNGRALYQARDGALTRLAGFVLDNYRDPAPLKALSGHKQDLKEGLNPRSMAWLEPYYARTRDPRAASFIAQSRPLAHRSAGGNLTVLFGAPLPAGAG